MRLMASLFLRYTRVVCASLSFSLRYIRVYSPPYASLVVYSSGVYASLCLPEGV